MDNERLRIDTLRGIACILLVSYHIIGYDYTMGLRIVDGVYREANDLLGLIRMPLFTFLSGFVYAYRPFREGVLLFLKGKSRRLLLPMLSVGTIFAIIQSIMPGTNNAIENWYLLHIVPVAHFWFVQALFLIFIVVCLLEIIKAFNTFKRFLLVFVFAVLLYISDIYLVYFSVSGAIYLAPYFLFGMALNRYSFLKKQLAFYSNFILIFLVILSIYYLVNISVIPSKRSFLALLLGLFFCYALYSSAFTNPFLSKIGGYSYSIFIFHVFFTAASRIFLTKIGVSNIELLLILSLFAGIAGPIIVEMILLKNNLAKKIFLGK